MVQEYAHRCDSRILSGLRTNGPMARDRAALHHIRSLYGDAALCVPHCFQLEKGTPLLARRAAVECARPFHHLQRGLLRYANFLWTHRRCSDRTTTARESIDAEV